VAFKKISDLKKLYRRISVLLYGKTRIGKTTMLLDIIRNGEILFAISTDKGLMDAMTEAEWEKYDENVRVSLSKGIVELRKDLALMHKKIMKMVNGGVPPHEIWFIIDTLTHMQADLLTECRTIAVGKGSGNPTVGGTVLRDAVQQVDYGILFAWMNEIVSGCMNLPCNVVFIALEKTDRDAEPRIQPALTGQSSAKVAGDVQVIAHLEHSGKKGRDRALRVHANGECVAGTRGDKNLFKEYIKPDLLEIRDTLIG